MECKDLFFQGNSGRRRNENIILPRPEMNLLRNSIGTGLTNKETRDKTLKVFKRCLANFDTDKMNFEPILAITISYKYFKQFVIVNCTFVFSPPYSFCNCCIHDPTSTADLPIVLK